MRHKRAARIRTQKIIDRLLYEPQKHKQKFTKALRQNIQVTGNGNVIANSDTFNLPERRLKVRFYQY